MSDARTVTVTDDSFTKVVLNSTKPVLVDFWAQWCGPCTKIAPVLDEIASEHTDITIAKLDVDANPNSTKNFRIMSIPTMVLFHEGKVVKQIVGTKDKAALLEALADVLS
ncbi:thioredoxin [Rhodococcus sp. NPDC127530]|uniref:thioredoxin n=1 Tax=unclassified Rhodococcus (in: high G+C Gram-positive bacteria) TaxID=192944 RepID=UPI003629F08A